MTSTSNVEQSPFSEDNTSRDKSTRIIVTVVSILLVAAIAIVSILLINNSRSNNSANSESSPSSTVASIDPAKLAQTGISLGSDLVAGTKNKGAVQVDIFFDYACSHCNHLGTEFGAALGGAAKKGDITLVYHPVSIMNTLFSYTGAAAELFVADNEPEAYFQFHELLHAQIMTPYMNGELQDPRANDIVTVARQAGVTEEKCETLSQKLTEMEDILLANDHSRSADLLERVTKATDDFIDESVKATGSAGTPTVYFDGKKTSDWSQDIPALLKK